MASTSNSSKPDPHPEGEWEKLSSHEKNPHQFSGPRDGFETKEVNNGSLYIRVDMPGVEKEDLEIWVQGTTVFLHGQARKLWDEEPSPPRHHRGSITLRRGDDSAKLDREEIDSDLKNGVLRMLIPNAAVDTINYPSPSSTNLSPYKNPFPDIHLKDLRPGGLRPQYRVIADHIVKFRIIPIFEPDPNCGVYPFQVTGVIGPYEAAVIGDDMYMKVDMPGITMDDFKSKLEGNRVAFAGTEPRESEHDGDELRKYFFSMSQFCSCCNITHFKFEVKAGVVRMRLFKKKMKVSNKDTTRAMKKVRIK